MTGVSFQMLSDDWWGRVQVPHHIEKETQGCQNGTAQKPYAFKLPQHLFSFQ